MLEKSVQKGFGSVLKRSKKAPKETILLDIIHFQMEYFVVSFLDWTETAGLEVVVLGLGILVHMSDELR